MALEHGDTLLKVANPPRYRVIRPDGLSILELRDPFAELTGPHGNEDDGDQPRDCEYWNADHQHNGQYLHGVPTFRD
jgi:hypothetical protein